MSQEKRKNGWLGRTSLSDDKRTSRLFNTRREAKEWETSVIAESRTADQPLGDGPDFTTLA
jgi:hypothetical protein